MLAYIWTTLLYQPLFNVLIYIYEFIADKNMGWAVVWLTIFLRIAMLPLTIISERNAYKEVKAEEEALKASAAFRHDPVAQKESIRQVMRRNKINPWAKVITLGIQVLVLILLYQVFIHGISGEKMFKMLYPVIDFPGKINNNFYGFDIGLSHNEVWAGFTALYLFASILIENRKRKKWSNSEVTFLVAFPLFTFGALYFLPMVKALFILTTMIFSDIITLIRIVIFPVKEAEKTKK